MGNILSSNYTYKDTILDLGANGALLGTIIDNKVKRFTAVPYAQPPVGPLRWRKTQALPKEYVYADGQDPSQPLKCKDFGALCWQPQYTKVANKKEGTLFSEDCLTLNIWMPAGPAPENGWPVMLWFHGGWLQVGDPSVDPTMDPTELISATGGGLQCIFIAVGYRLSLFGFLASKELAEEAERDGPDGAWGNYGLWDQWTAWMWLRSYGDKLGADVRNVTLAGRSAGAYSAHAQAAHAFFMTQGDPVGSDPELFKGLVMYSNAIPTNPKSLEDVQPQFDELLSVCDIPHALSGKEKLAALRAVDAKTLISKVMDMKAHTFRPVADGKFFPVNLFERFMNGEFAEEFKKRELGILIGEVLNEETLYRQTNPPKDLATLRDQIANYYPLPVTDKIIKAYLEDKIHVPSALPDPDPNVDQIQKLFGDIVSDGQVRAPSRLLLQQLKEAGVPLDRVHRYLISWKPSFAQEMIPEEMGIPHAADRPIWNYSVMHGPTPAEEKTMKTWIDDLTNFIHGRPVNYGTSCWQEHKELCADGEISVQQDHKWDYLLSVAHIMAGNEAFAL